jgi:hypothetical protein
LNAVLLHNLERGVIGSIPSLAGQARQRLARNRRDWPAPGSDDTELGVLMGPEGGHGETEVHARVQA